MRVKIWAFSQKDQDGSVLFVWSSFTAKVLTMVQLGQRIHRQPEKQSKRYKQVVVALPGAKAQAWPSFMSNHWPAPLPFGKYGRHPIAGRPVRFTKPPAAEWLCCFLQNIFCGFLEDTVFVRWAAQPGWFYLLVAIICASVPFQNSTPPPLPVLLSCI